MGFFCYTCGRKVRGQPIKHKCTRKGGMRLQQSIYANKRAVKEYNQKRSQGKNPPKPKCMRKQKNRRTKTGSSSTKGDFSKNKKSFRDSCERDGHEPDECITCGCLKRNENCLYDSCKREGCIFCAKLNELDTPITDECITCGCLKRNENCLCDSCKRGGCIVEWHFY